MEVEVFDLRYPWRHPLVAQFAVRIGPTRIYGYELHHWVGTEVFCLKPPKTQHHGAKIPAIKWEDAYTSHAVERKVLDSFQEKSNLTTKGTEFVWHWHNFGGVTLIDETIYKNDKCWRISSWHRSQITSKCKTVCNALIEELTEQHVES